MPDLITDEPTPPAKPRRNSQEVVVAPPGLRAREWIMIVTLLIAALSGTGALAASVFCTKAESESKASTLRQEAAAVAIKAALVQQKVDTHETAQYRYESDVKDALKEISTDVKAINKRLDRMERSR